jgi:phosphatidylserine/phosphatidylglycerophosphate/cardiolipin synthase-like enzyme
LADVLSRVDKAAGKALERLVIAHQRRRLGRCGRGDALRPPAGGWAASAAPPRPGNTLDVLVDGADALPQLAAAIESARSSVWLAGWFFSPGFRLRAGSDQTLRELLADVAEREVNVVTRGAAVARDTRLRLWSEHLGRSADEISGDPVDVIDELWRRPQSERLRRLPHVSRRSAGIWGPLNGLLVDG